MKGRDYYHTLGVARTETSHGIRTAFRELALRYHPDRAGERGTPLFQEITEAYRTLSNPRARASYDRGLNHAEDELPARPIRTEPVAAFRAEPLVAEPLVAEPLSLMRDFVAKRPTVDDVFDRIRRNFTDTWLPKSRRLDPVNIRIDLTPEQALRGGAMSFGVPVFYPCPSCRGSGRQWLYPCHVCGENGMLGYDHAVRLYIPAGARDGMVFELPLTGFGIRNLLLAITLRIGH